jgi:pilus assembly protein CpaF
VNRRLATADDDTANLARSVHARLIDERVAGSATLARTEVAAAVRDAAPLLGPSRVAEVVDRVMATVSGLGALEPLLADDDVNEVMVNGPGAVWIERGGRLEQTDVMLDVDEIRHLIEKVVGPLGLRVDRLSPLVDARLPDGSRINAVVPPLAVDGPCLTIRRFGARRVELAEMTGLAVVALLRWAVQARLNILVSGGTGAGKTTVLNALARFVPAGERLITVEDVAELALDHPHVVRLEARPPTADGIGEVEIRDLVRNALRMRPDRIVVGEVRGVEALDMLQAMNTGHEGSLSTCHANTPEDALRRIESMILMSGADLPLHALRDQIRASIDLVVEVTRAASGRRTIAAVAEVLPGAGGEPVDVRSLTEGDTVVAGPLRGPRRGDAGAYTGVATP